MHWFLRRLRMRKCKINTFPQNPNPLFLETINKISIINTSFVCGLFVKKVFKKISFVLDPRHLKQRTRKKLKLIILSLIFSSNNLWIYRLNYSRQALTLQRCTKFFDCKIIQMVPQYPTVDRNELILMILLDMKVHVSPKPQLYVSYHDLYHELSSDREFYFTHFIGLAHG